MKLSNLFEGKHDLIGKTITNISRVAGALEKEVSVKITAETANEHWEGARGNRDFDCSTMFLKTLKGSPASIDGDYICSDNLLTSLEGCTPIIGGDFYCKTNKLTSLQGIHKIIKEVNGELAFSNNPIKSHVLGVLLIKGVTGIELDYKGESTLLWHVRDILNTHLPNAMGNKGVLACQSELLDAGFDEFAQL
jgi:hypothetical protein